MTGASAAAPFSLGDASVALREHFGYPTFRQGQDAAVESVLAGRDTLVVLPTGGGKSICYQIPALMLPKLTVVISPLISLMKDQVDALTARGLPATFVNSTLTSAQISDRLARTQRGEIKLLYVAPERFDTGTIADRLRDVGVSLLAVDEAHCISEWGHDFRPSYLRIAQVRQRLGSPPVVALTATATPQVRADIVRQLQMDHARTIITGFDRQNLRYHVVGTKTDSDKDSALVRIIRSTEGVAIVYASTRRAVEQIAGLLETSGIPAEAYHAGLDDARRRRVQDAFMKEEVRAIVATNAFGMGIDKPNVRRVVHYTMPGTLEAYYQEAGRAGRDGLPAECFLLHAFPDRFTHEFFIKVTYPDRSLVEAVYKALRHRADDTGAVDLSPDDIASLLSIKANAREVEAALRILASTGAYRAEAEMGSRIAVRLLATPERITQELAGGKQAAAGEPESPELGILRAMWRAVGEKLYLGATIDLDGMPPGFRGTAGAIPILDALRDRQFVDWKRAGPGSRLTDPRAPLTNFAIDWQSIDRRRRADLAKLDVVQKYAYSKQCRRGFVLRYFGDPAAGTNCGGCDNCLGTRMNVAEPRERVASRGRPRRQPRSPTTPAVTPRQRGVVAGREAADPLTPRDDALLGKLRALRSAIAREDKVPAYVVFPDSTLMEIAVRRPRSMAALDGIRGVGPVKLDRYGERFLQVVRAAGEPGAA